MKTRTARECARSAGQFIDKHLTSVPVDWLYDEAEDAEEEALQNQGYPDNGPVIDWDMLRDDIDGYLTSKAIQYIDFVAENYPEEFKDGMLDEWLKTR